MARVTAVFDDQAQAELAVTELRRLGVTDTDLSFVARSEEEAVGAGASPDSAGKRAAKGVWVRSSPRGRWLPLLGRLVGHWLRARSWVVPRVLSPAG